MAASMRIDLFTDIICPWCLIGTANFDKALGRLDRGIEVRIRHHPFLLDPSIPPQGEKTKERLETKYRGDIGAMQGRVEQAARAAGVALDLSVQPMSYPTQKAHTLIRLAPEQEQYPLAKAFTAAYFLEGRNIADDAVLTQIALGHRFASPDAARLLADAAELRTTEVQARSASAQGINGVPFFIFNARYAISGAQPVGTFTQAFERVLSEAMPV